MRYLYFIFIFVSSLYSLDFKVATYNVENFFDLHYDKTEYKEYKPHTKTWNQQTYNTKLKNINRVIKELEADILALQEIESKIALQAILKKNLDYKYFAFHKNKNSAIGLALISKYKITSYTIIKVDKYDKYSRDILKVNFLIENKPLTIYVNHWRSKRAQESQRIKYALSLKKEIDKHPNDDYIILGDLNSNYNEYQTFKYDKKLNDTYNITGINQILNTTIKGNLVRKKDFQYYKDIHFNTWLELKKYERFSTKFRKQNNTPDNIILSSTLFDNKNISYIDKSFQVFKPSYLHNKQKIIRWNKKKQKGYSDHLPIFASFSTKPQKYNFQQKAKSKLYRKNSIKHLYQVEQVSNYKLEDVIVIYKTNSIAIIKEKDTSSAIMIYRPTYDFKIGFSYDITINKIDEYNGLKEIKKISDIQKKGIFTNPTKLYLDGNKIDLFDKQFLNNIVTHIKGVYKKRHLYFKNSKIKLYFKKGIKKPKEGESISISSGHLSIYKSSMQIVLHRDKDFKKL